MLELALKIVPWLALAALLGFVVAWLLRGLQLAELKAQLEHLEAEHSVREHELGSSRRTLDAALERVASLERQVKTIMRTESARSESASRAARGAHAANPGELSSPMQTASATPPMHGRARDAAADAAVRGEGARRADGVEPGASGDDLTCIYGVGPVLAKMLHRLGVHQFRQVAQWSEADIDFFDAQLERFRGRIRRENWVRSAAEEHHRKYGEWLGSGTAAPVMREALHD
jgi:predicted flap endonuclease-1-like 5' DNA nuclease